MKKQFFDYLFEVMKTNPDVYIIFTGLGWPRVDDFLNTYPDRAINTEAAEQTALDIAVGLAYSGKIPFVYTITPFYLRGFETIRTYINHEKLHVCMVGAGRDDDYSKVDGFSHEAGDIGYILKTMQNIRQYYPNVENEMKQCVNWMIETNEPSFLSVTK